MARPSVWSLARITGLTRTWAVFFGPTLSAVRAVPSLAWVPLLLLWLKIGEESKITLHRHRRLLSRLHDGVSVAPARGYATRGSRSGVRPRAGLRLLTTIQLPAALPAVMSGLRLALAQSWLFLVAAELIASSAGLGFLLVDSQANGRVDRILLAILMLGAIGLLSDTILGWFERRAIRRWT